MRLDERIGTYYVRLERTKIGRTYSRPTAMLFLTGSLRQALLRNYGVESTRGGSRLSSFGRFARGFVTASLALCFAMTAITYSPSINSVYTATYIDVLDDDSRHDAD